MELVAAFTGTLLSIIGTVYLYLSAYMWHLYYLPPWMSSRENDDRFCGKKQTWDGEDGKSNEDEKPKQAKGCGK